MEKALQIFFSLWKGVFETGQAIMENKIAFGIIVTVVTIIAIVLPFCVAYVFVSNNRRVLAYILTPITSFMIWLIIEFGLAEGTETIHAIRAIIEGIGLGIVLSILEIAVATLLNQRIQAKQNQKKRRKK